MSYSQNQTRADLMSDSEMHTVCHVQGKLFKISASLSFESECFIRCFLNSELAKQIDGVYSSLPYLGEEYILESLQIEKSGKLRTGKPFSQEELYSLGYVLRFWHYKTGENSKKIYKTIRKVEDAYYILFTHMDDMDEGIEMIKKLAEKKS